ncbi:MAG: PhzF family phenazine biosynthesis protein [Bacteroidales bacterium]
MKIPIYQVDAFTQKLFGGNPAAVCPLKKWPDDALMQQIAAENNLSETAFFVDNGNHYYIRWFTPKTEIDLCGHATLASAYDIFNYLKPELSEIRFKTKLKGGLFVTKSGDLISLDFPTAKAVPCKTPDQLSESLGKKPIAVYQARDLMAVFESEDDIVELQPDFEQIKKLGYHAIIVTAPGKKSDFVSRFFAPNVGINEDPVTGSAHTTLMPYWAERLGKKTLHAFQLSERKGELFCEYNEDRVIISGKAVLYLVGEISVT